MKKMKENLDEYDIFVKACKAIADDAKTGKKLFQVLYEEKVHNRQFDMEVDESKSCKSYVELKPNTKYKVTAEEYLIPEVYSFNGEHRARLKRYYRVVKIIEQLKNV